MASVIQTKELPTKSFGSREVGCVLCGADVESSLHLFKDCHCIRDLAFETRWGSKLDLWSPSSIEEWIIYGLKWPFTRGEIGGEVENVRIFFWVPAILYLEL